MIKRHKTQEVWVGNVPVGGDHPITVQSMTNTDTRNAAETIQQIKELESIGCEIIRVAVPDMEAANKLEQIKREINIPLVADIHFDYRLALTALSLGIDALRINPGNIGSKTKVQKVVEKAQEKNIPIRIGVNAGSLEKHLLEKYGGPTPEAMIESALAHVNILESLKFDSIIISLKASDVLATCKAYELMAQRCNYPLHLGITEAGTLQTGTIKSAIGIGSLLLNGIGDTIRISLTAHPKEEVRVAFEILKALGIRQKGPKIISCPTCGRCEIDLIRIAREVEDALQDVQYPYHIAVMGCVVNGPGEAREADFGIAGGKECGIVFKKGKPIHRVEENELVATLLDEIKKDEHLRG